MSAPDLNAETMAQFRDAGVEQHSTILLGAGASITSGLPSWDEFATSLLIDSGAVDKRSAELLLARQDPIIAVEAARAADEATWKQRLRDALYKSVGTLASLSPSPLHLAAVGHYLERKDRRSLVTLNFDVLLETVLEDETKTVPIAVTNTDERKGEHSVHHLHGIITPDETHDVVLTLNDFTTLLEKQDAWQVNYLRTAVTKGSLVIAGTSYRDPDLRQWLHAALKSKPKDHKAFVLLAREGFGVSKKDFGELEQALSSQWRAVGLHPVLMQDHTDAAQIIRELNHVNKKDYISPQERCRLIWESHVRNFEVLQQEYVGELSKNVEELKKCFKVETLDATIWISNGDGGLVRWASHDRIYRTLQALRVVETGHDSPWIAGQALAKDTEIIRDLSHHPTRRWKSVVAFPIPVAHPTLPLVSSAVLTIGLPKEKELYEGDSVNWAEVVGDIADEWTFRLYEGVYSVEDA